MKFTKDQIKTYFKQILYFLIDTFGWCRSLCVYLFRNIKKPGTFYGYSNYYWACKYADKRSKGWKCSWDQQGKKQGVFPLAEVTLLVCSALELKQFKKKVPKARNLKPRKAIKKSYYTTT